MTWTHNLYTTVADPESGHPPKVAIHRSERRQPRFQLGFFVLCIVLYPGYVNTSYLDCRHLTKKDITTESSENVAEASIP